MDDIAVLDGSVQECQTNVTKVIDLLGEMGFIINHGQSNLTPRQVVSYIGYVIDTSSMRISLPLEKMSKISDLARNILSSRTCSVRTLVRMIGLIVSPFRVVLQAKIHYGSLEHLKLQTFKVSHGNFGITLSLTPAVRSYLLWWVHSGHLKNGVSLRKPIHIVSFTSDASISGWATVFEGQHIRGRWIPPEACMHINYLELLAIF